MDLLKDPILSSACVCAISVCKSVCLVILKIAVLVSEAFCCCVEKASVCKSFCVEASVKKKTLCE